MKRPFSKLLFSLFILLNIHSDISAQIITTVAGGGSSLSDGIPATVASISYTPGIAIDAYGNLYIGDGNNNRVRKVDIITGIITTIAGTGIAGYNGDNIPAMTAQLNKPGYVVFDRMDNLYIGETNGYRIRKVDAITGTITTYAGNGILGYTGDGGLADTSEISNAIMAMDNIGNMYIADNFRIRKVDTLGIITTIAGTGISGSSGDGGQATTAMVNYELGICTDDSGNVYFSDNNNYTVRKINVNTGIINTIAGTGGIANPYLGDGFTATSSHINPFGISVDDTGNLYIADRTNSRIEKVDTSGVIYSLTGNGSYGFGGDGGFAIMGVINQPENVVLNACGNIYISDYGNRRVRKVTYPPVLTIPTITLSGIPSASVGALVTVTATVTNAGSSYEIEWYNHGIEFATTTVPSVTYAKPAGIDTITARVVSTATYGCYDSTTSAGHVVMVSEGITSPGLSKGEVTVWPNPANDIINIDGVVSSSSYRLLSIVGAVMQQGILKEGSNSIPVQLLPAGMYMVEVSSAGLTMTGGHGERVVRKIIKQ